MCGVLTSAALAACCNSWNFARVSFTANSACSAFKLSFSTHITPHHITSQYITQREEGAAASIESVGCMVEVCSFRILLVLWSGVSSLLTHLTAA